MKFGVCGSPAVAMSAQKAGLDYFEWTVGEFLQPRNDDPSFQRTLKEVKEAPLDCPIVNVFIPGDLKITGSFVDEEKLGDYVETSLLRAKFSGIKIIVFGSGGARRIPENYDLDLAYQQLLSFGQMVAAKAERYNVIIAVEPLNKQECNILNSVQECALYVREVNHPNFKLLVDAYHWLKEGESTNAIVDAGDLLVHAHIATPMNRLPPGAEKHDFSSFFGALKQSGYEGRLSIEARLDNENIEGELLKAIETIRTFIA